MKTTDFATSIEDLKEIINDTKDLSYTLEIQNRPLYRDVLVKVTAKEEAMAEFIDRNDLYKCIGEVTEL